MLNPTYSPFLNNTSVPALTHPVQPKFGIDMNEASDEELMAELNKRNQLKEETALAIQTKRNVIQLSKRVGSPVGIWKVTTEGDVEGRIRRDLGTYTGHILDIAARLSPRNFNTLTFTPVTPQEELPMPKKASTLIALDYNSGTWEMATEERALTFKEWLNSESPESVSSFEASKTNVFAAVKLDIKA